MAEFINIYEEDQSKLILRDNSSPTSTKVVPTLGGSDVGSSYKNAFFLEVNVFDENNTFLFKLNSGLPLLQKQNGYVYLGRFHIHDGGVYMEGEKHSVIPHPSLVKIRDNQLNVFPINQSSYIGDTYRSWCIKPSEIFEIMKMMEDFEVEKNSKFKIRYAILSDVLLSLGEKLSGVNN